MAIAFEAKFKTYPHAATVAIHCDPPKALSQIPLKNSEIYERGGSSLMPHSYINFWLDGMASQVKRNDVLFANLIFGYVETSPQHSLPFLTHFTIPLFPLHFPSSPPRPLPAPSSPYPLPALPHFHFLPHIAPSMFPPSTFNARLQKGVGNTSPAKPFPL